MNNKQKKTAVYGAILALTILGILLLTFQPPAGTVKLSETVRLWLEGIGIRSNRHSLRSNAHLIEYFCLGIILNLFCLELGWSFDKTLLFGCAFGMLDECLKIMIPTREFSLADWIKDCLGVIAAVMVVSLITMKKKE